MREKIELVQSQATRIKRLEGKEDNMKNSYEELKKKSEEKLEGYDDLRDLQRATFNHFLAKWEHANESKEGDAISKLKNAFPLAIRKFFPEEIEKYKDSLK